MKSQNPYTNMDNRSLMQEIKKMRLDRTTYFEERKFHYSILNKTAIEERRIACQTKIDDLNKKLICIKDDINEAQGEWDRRHGIMPQAQWDRRNGR